MSNSSEKRSAAKGKNAQSSQQKQSPTFVSRYIAIDSHLIERNGSIDQVFGIAGERPAGRKLAKDIANVCNQFDAEGYDIFDTLPIVSGRIVEATVEAAEEVRGRTYRIEEKQESKRDIGDFYTDTYYPPKTEIKHYVDTGAGYSVTDGVVIVAKLRS